MDTRMKYDAVETKRVIKGLMGSIQYFNAKEPNNTS